MKCLSPEGCENKALVQYSRCLAHIEKDIEQAIADNYAIASILYYSMPEVAPFFEDANYDGHCRWLLSEKSYKRIHWLEQDMLKAGSGYDIAKFPEYLQNAAQELAKEQR